MKSCVVVGGGLCGLFSAIVLADKFHKVTLVESASECGGLLKSVTDEHGVVYDQGTHIPNTTLNEEIDYILFGDEATREEQWNKLGRLKTGNYINGHWDLTTQIADARTLPLEQYQKGIAELLSLVSPSDASDILTYLRETLGPTFTDNIAVPIFKKLYGSDVDVSQLMTNSSVNYFGLSRVVALSPEITVKLKELPVFDRKLAYHTVEDFERRVAQDNITETVLYYPKKGRGVQFWIDHLVKQAKAKGVEFIFNDTVTEIIHDQGEISSVSLANSKQSLACDFLYWSAPPFFALKAAKLPFTLGSASFRTANIYHFTFDRPLLNQDSHYLWNWDSQFKSFRVTLFPNLRLDDNDSGVYNLSIESLTSAEEAEEINRETMLDELNKMGLISREAKVLSEHKQVIHNTFPVPTFNFTETSQKYCQELANGLSNFIISGRFSGKQWFHADIIKAAYTEINSRYPNNI